MPEVELESPLWTGDLPIGHTTVKAGTGVKVLKTLSFSKYALTIALLRKTGLAGERNEASQIGIIKNWRIAWYFHVSIGTKPYG